MKLAVMQPYFLPYLGYWQLMNMADTFVVYDNIQFSKRGWFHRNRLLLNKKEEMFTIPLKKDSDFLNINERFISKEWEKGKRKLLSKIEQSYSHAEFYKEGMEIVERVLADSSDNLFDFIFNSINVIKEYLSIDTQLIVSSSLSIDHSLTKEKKLFEICKVLSARRYINPIGGKALYKKDEFSGHQIDLEFHNFIPREYQQFSDSFISHLSVIDVIMHCGCGKTNKMLKDFYLD